MIHKVIIPDNRTVNLSFTVPENYVGEEMEVIAFIKKEGLQQTELSELLSPSLQGNPCQIRNSQTGLNRLKKCRPSLYKKLKVNGQTNARSYSNL